MVAKKSKAAKSVEVETVKIAENVEIVKPVEEKSKKQSKKDTFKFFNDESARIWYAPNSNLTNGEKKLKKLMAYAFFNQKEPAVIRDHGSNEVCKICQSTFMKFAKISWKIYSREKDEYFPYTLDCVCPKCCQRAGVFYINDYEIVGAMHNDKELAYRKIGDGQGFICEVCFKDDGNPTTLVHVRTGKYLYPVPCCAKHLEYFCGVGKMPELNDGGDLPSEWLLKLKIFNQSQSFANEVVQ